MTSPHEILGISAEATEEEIRKAYRRAAMQHHPDRGGSTETFLAVQAAYDALQKQACPTCGGKGFTTLRQGFFVSKTPCPKCWKI